MPYPFAAGIVGGWGQLLDAAVRLFRLYSTDAFTGITTNERTLLLCWQRSAKHAHVFFVTCVHCALTGGAQPQAIAAADQP